MEKKTISQERNELVYKSNELIRDTRYELTEVEQKLVIYLISKIDNNNDTAPQELTLRLKDYCDIVGVKYSGGMIEYIKDSIQALRNKSWWIPTGKKKQTLFSWIDTADLEGETITIKLSKSLQPFLFELQKDYTRYSLVNVLSLKGKYSIRMYEVLKSYAYKNCGNGYTLRIELDTLKDIINCTKYPAYAEFTRNVLKPSLKEINNYTDIEVSYKNIRIGREVKEIEFYIKEKEGSIAVDAALNRIERLEG